MRRKTLRRADVTADDALTAHRLTWQRKPVLRAIYEDFYRRIIAVCIPGRTLEVGGGSGNLKAYLPQVVSTDIVIKPWLDAAADAQALPFVDGAFSNLVCVDVLHHVERPCRFLREAARVLKPGGNLVLLEPAITPVSWVFNKLAHPEPVDMGADPLADGPLDPNRDPFDANQAIPTLLLGRYLARFREAVPQLALAHFEYLSLFAYPLSGGFRSWSLIPSGLTGPLLRLEAAVMPAVGRLAAFRLLAVIRRQDAA